ncbi:MAG: hypothetical protein ABH859_02970 [Pseudomonadota bacterium]
MKEIIEQLISTGYTFTFKNNSRQGNTGIYSSPSADFQAWIAQVEDFIIKNYGRDSTPYKLFKNFNLSLMSGYGPDVFYEQHTIIIGALKACQIIAPSEESEKNVRNREITETQFVPDLLTGADIGTWQKDYSLREIDFERIKRGRPITFTLAISIALTTFGFGLQLLAKGYSNIANINKGDKVTLVIGIALSAVLYIIGLCLPNDRKKVMKKIEKHFKEAPTKRHAFKEQNK